MRETNTKVAYAFLGLCTVGMSPFTAAVAQESSGSGESSTSWFSDLGIRANGFVRVEGALGTTSDENRNNQAGNVLNDRTVSRTAFCPPALCGGKWGNIPFGVSIPASTPLLGPATAGLGLGNIGFSDTVHRGDFVSNSEDDINYSIVRAESEVQVSLSSQLTLIGRIRALYAMDLIDGFDPGSVDGLQGGIDGGDPDLYRQKPNFFEFEVEGGGNPNPLEWAGKDYLVYFPALVLDYTSGNLNVRAGNQSIAWGQAIFFRAFDLPNGLDYRRHLILDRELEEFSDKRQPALSIRATYQATEQILLDSYVSKFQPTIYPNPGTPYNVIPTQFTVHEQYKQGGFDDKINFGFRLKGDYGQWGWQALYVRRYNPDGTFRWTESGVNKQLTGLLGSIVNTAYAAKLPYSGVGDCNPAICRLYGSIGEALSHSPFEASPAGVYSQEEWFNYAADARLDALGGLNASISDFAGSQDAFATLIDLPTSRGGSVTEEEARRQADAQLNTFFMAAGGSLRGHIERTYHQEDVFGLGVSYVNESDNDFLNQLIFNLEVQYTPERAFTNTTLGRKAIEQDEYTVSLVMDKWHRLFKEFPGTYMVFQTLTKNRSDLVGRSLQGFGGSEAHAATGKSDNATYVVFGFLQPFPNKIYAIEFATLLDTDGGILAQPLIQWNPGKGVTVEAFYNFIDDSLWGTPTDNLLSTIGWAEEVGLRVAYQF
jgi:hypothetical protein